MQDVIGSTVFGNSLELVPTEGKTGYGTVPRSAHITHFKIIFVTYFHVFVVVNFTSQLSALKKYQTV